ncbi:MAG: binding-protein-dependent transport system inner rane component [Actinomycetia bacterium]|nr:binding-protein-dependent transport system inner rane component [Actinomycetes bacterium]
MLSAQQWFHWSWVADHSDDIRAALAEHLQLTLVAMVAGLVISLPLGVAAVRWRRLRTPVLLTEGVLYAIPSLAAIVLLGPWTGYLTRTTVAIPLTAYTLLILTRNVVTGLEAVPEEVRESATGMGYGPTRRLLRVELPLALPTIIAGIRIATVSTIAMVTIGFVAGHGGLGELVDAGIRAYVDYSPLTVGLALTVALAVTADLLLQLVQRLLTPWARAGR